jgi:hypothetical protein
LIFIDGVTIGLESGGKDLELPNDLDAGGAVWKATEALLLSLRNSSDACRAVIAISCDFSVSPSSRINPWK